MAITMLLLLRSPLAHDMTQHRPKGGRAQPPIGIKQTNLADKSQEKQCDGPMSHRMPAAADAGTVRHDTIAQQMDKPPRQEPASQWQRQRQASFHLIRLHAIQTPAPIPTTPTFSPIHRPTTVARQCKCLLQTLAMTRHRQAVVASQRPIMSCMRVAASRMSLAAVWYSPRSMAPSADPKRSSCEENATMLRRQSCDGDADVSTFLLYSIHLRDQTCRRGLYQSVITFLSEVKTKVLISDQ